MKKDITKKIQSSLLTFILLVTAFCVGSAVAAEKKMVTDPATGKMVTGVWRVHHPGHEDRARSYGPLVWPSDGTGGLVLQRKTGDCGLDSGSEQI